MLMVMPRWRSSGALSIWSNADAWLRVGYLSARTLVMAAVRVVLPWSTWPMVPMLTCGLLRSNFAFATAGPPQDCCRPSIVVIAWRYGWIWTGPTARTRRRRGCLPHHLRLGPEQGSGGWSVGEEPRPPTRDITRRWP